MSHFETLNTLQYMGSKTRIINDVCAPIAGNDSIDTVVDLFAGTGTVGYALMPQFSIISNDLEYYAYVLNEAILNGCMISDEQLNDIINNCKAMITQLRTRCGSAISKEEYFFNIAASNDALKDYQNFCNETPSVISTNSKDPIFKELVEIIKQIESGKASQNIDIPSLFVTYYANAYFGISQCCEIDAIRANIGLINDNRVQYVLLTALMSAMSNTASTTTHFAQFLKINGISSYKNIITKRRTSILDLFARYINDFKTRGLLNKKFARAVCTNLDYLELLNSIPLDETTMVYADPPYFKEHYSRYYHILNTVCKYDYPIIANNPQTREFSVGRYRKDRNVSNFGKRKTALSAFHDMIKICAQSKAWLTISYSTNSIVKIDDILAVMNEYYDVNTIKIPLKHSKQGRVSTSNVDEYLFTGKPFNVNKVIGQKQVVELLEILSKTKPYTDNPAGFMHNYMARKPFNIVKEIIAQLCPEDGIVYDPMMGSGTTLIEASKLGIKSIGTDINPLAYKITHASLTSWDIPKVESLLDDFVNSIYSCCYQLYSVEEDGETRIIERCHFDKTEKYPQKLVPVSYWYRTTKNGKPSGRKKAEATDSFIAQYNSYENCILSNISDIALIPNSRIAIGQNDSVYMYFCARNLIALDLIIGELKHRKKQYGYAVLELMVSSAINLIKLSDKKASSQMPYWTPNKNVTSRNALGIIQQKKSIFIEGLKFLDLKCHTRTVGSYQELTKEHGALVLDTPAQSISYSLLPKQSIDLVVTDPPYTDQVPYLEYSQLWNHILGWNNELSVKYDRELVVSDAPSRKKDITNFNELFNEIIRRTANSVKDGCHFVMFYHSFDLASWNNIILHMGNHGFAYQGQAPVASPRKSFKAIMSPNSTLDGNYVIVFRKRVRHQPIFDGTITDAENTAVECARKIINSGGAVTSQDLYDHGMLKDAVEKGYLGLLASKYRTFIDVVNPFFEFENGFWREK